MSAGAAATGTGTGVGAGAAAAAVAGDEEAEAEERTVWLAEEMRDSLTDWLADAKSRTKSAVLASYEICQ